MKSVEITNGLKCLLAMVVMTAVLHSGKVMGQGTQKLVFEYRCVPTSTSSYLIEIVTDKFTLKREELVLSRNGRFKRIDSSRYSHFFSPVEKQVLDSIIKANKLDSVALYQRQKMDWGALWKVKIEQNAITYNIDLPNYSNPGLEALIRFVVCLIPKKELPVFMCDECNESKRLFFPPLGN